MGSGAQAHTIGSYCVSQTTDKITLCTSVSRNTAGTLRPDSPRRTPAQQGKGIPEQINVQIASGDAVVVGFVTYEDTDPTAAPVVELNGTEIKGVTHTHNPCTVGKSCVGGP